MIDEAYAKDCVVEAMSVGMVFNGREQLRVIEHQMLAASPTRRMDVDRYISAGDVVVVECTMTGMTPKPTKCCAVLTFKNGLIISDHSYGPPPSG